MWRFFSRPESRSFCPPLRRAPWPPLSGSHKEEPRTAGVVTIAGFPRPSAAVLTRTADGKMPEETSRSPGAAGYCAGAEHCCVLSEVFVRVTHFEISGTFRNAQSFCGGIGFTSSRGLSSLVSSGRSCLSDASFAHWTSIHQRRPEQAHVSSVHITSTYPQQEMCICPEQRPEHPRTAPHYILPQTTAGGRFLLCETERLRAALQTLMAASRLPAGHHK